MTDVSFYSLETGMFDGRNVTVSGDFDENNIPPGHAMMDGHHDARSQRVELATGSVVDFKPPQPSADHEWDIDSRTWVLTATAQAVANERQIALRELARLDASQHRALLEHALGLPGGRERLEAIHAQKVELRKKL